jgi:putative cell wall-binding protein
VTETEIQRALPAGGSVLVVGGSFAIDTSVDDQLTADGFNVTRVAGVDRYDTAVKLASMISSTNPAVFLATGLNFPDALTAGSAAGSQSGVVLLTADGVMPAETAAYIQQHSPSSVFAVGGEAAAADPSAVPLVGADRFSTAVAVAQKFFTAPATVVLATGAQAPDAMVAGLLAATVKAALLLSGTTTPAATSSYLSANQSTITTTFVVGGSLAVAPPS